MERVRALHRRSAYERAVRHIARLERLRVLSEQGERPHYAFEAEELEHLRTLREAIHAEMMAAGDVVPSFQQRVHAWVRDFFPEHGVNVPERARRFIEEAIELAQAVGLVEEEVGRILARAYSRPAGQPHQEVGGTRVSLAALCAAIGLDETLEGERELERISAPGMRERMRARQAEKRAEGVGE